MMLVTEFSTAVTQKQTHTHTLMHARTHAHTHKLSLSLSLFTADKFGDRQTERGSYNTTELH